MSQHRHNRARRKEEFHEHAMGCSKCHAAAIKLAETLTTKPVEDPEAIRMVVRLCCVQGAVILLQWLRQESPERYAVVEK